MRAPRDTRLSAFVQEEPDAEEPSAGAEAPEGGPAAPEPLTVADVVQRASRLLAGDDVLADVWVKGEVTGFKAWSSGNWFFDLRDARAVLRCTMFRNDNARVKWPVKDGDEVLARGRVGVYAEKGAMQLYVQDLQPYGRGAALLALEELARRLQAEGLFADARKRPIPAHPRVVGVVTSLGGAVLRDIVRTVKRRNPAARVLVAGARVQGDEAPESIARAIAALNADGTSDVLIVGRGGGSVDDLWCWNDERVVRAVAGSRIPVISAVGHEVDWTLCDHAADRRASTPTAAAEMATPDALALLARIEQSERRAARALEQLVPSLRQDVDEALAAAEEALVGRIGRERELLAEKAARLDALSPLGVLARGYAVVRRGGRVVRAAADAPEGADVEVVLRDGTLGAKVTRNPLEVRRDGEGEEG